MERNKRFLARNVFPAFLLAFSMLLFSGFASAQTNEVADKSSLGSWTGVWAFLDDVATKYSTDPNTKSTVEIRLTSDNKGLEISRTVPNQANVTEVLIPDGTKRPITASNCSGWQSAKLIPDAGMIVSSSEMNCKDAGLLATTNVKMILAADKMVDILALKANGQTRLATRHLMFDHEVTSGASAKPAYATVIDRMALAAPWNMSMVVQLSKTMGTEILEASLMEKKVRLNLNSEALKELKNAKTPQRIIDLVVALAYPDKFHIEKNGTVELRPWIDSSSTSSIVRGAAIVSSVPRVDNFPGMLYNCYSINGYYSGYAYPSYPGGCYSYYSPFWWDYPVYVPSTIVVVPGGGGGGSGSFGGSPDNGRLSAGTGYVQIEPQGTGRHARSRDGFSAPNVSPSGSYSPSPSYSGSSTGSYSTGGSSGGSSSGGYSSAGSSSGGASASPGGYSSGGGGGGGAVPR